jgi:hypothetical protein
MDNNNIQDQDLSVESTAQELAEVQGKTKTTKQKVQVSREERARMNKLTEKVTSHVQEMARIVRGNLGMDVNVPVAKFTMTTGTPENQQIHLEFEPIIVFGDGNGCYADPPGICCECPCPE